MRRAATQSTAMASARLTPRSSPSSSRKVIRLGLHWPRHTGVDPQARLGADGLFPRLQGLSTQRVAVPNTRFATAKVRKEVGGLLSRELGFEPALPGDFRTITDYLALVVCLCVRLGFAKRHVFTVACSTRSSTLTTGRK